LLCLRDLKREQLKLNLKQNKKKQALKKFSTLDSWRTLSKTWVLILTLMSLLKLLKSMAYRDKTPRIRNNGLNSLEKTEKKQLKLSKPRDLT
jgi:hypothetical protein